jgi:uncharacterized protein with HEPN domain
LPDDLRDRHPQLPWRSIRDVGNFYRHYYDNVAASYVWETVTAALACSRRRRDQGVGRRGMILRVQSTAETERLP